MKMINLRPILKAIPRNISLGNFELRFARRQPSLVGMTTLDEQSWYRSIAKDYSARGEGVVIVDLGSWMGSIAISLARGARDVVGNNSPKKIYAIDRYIWEDWMRPFSQGLACDYLPGESFLPEVRKKFAIEGNILPIQADLNAYHWPDGNISVLLVDAMKSDQLAASIAQEFYPHLDLGACLIHQDFKHYYTPWIHVLQYRLRDNFEPFHNVLGAATFSFKVVSQIRSAILYRATDFSNIADDEIAAAIAYSMDLVDGLGKSNIAAAHVMHFINASRFEEAARLFQRYSAQFDSAGELTIVQKLFQKHSQRFLYD